MQQTFTFIRFIVRFSNVELPVLLEMFAGDSSSVLSPEG